MILISWASNMTIENPRKILYEQGFEGKISDLNGESFRHAMFDYMPRSPWCTREIQAERGFQFHRQSVKI